ncbi:MAG: hypothetical protein HY852_17425 [Bradyrhizobium sp.]|uniref:hypothetical protein n=1 Tax=Bradyrhizobium sp. TaxID=376 RepID=UPI0025C6D0BF|nr:hypothetical protein [Bradyrhizobium sp.]MBI5263592.1 hypothetical protein [Bradyrhizobium sp.]
MFLTRMVALAGLVLAILPMARADSAPAVLKSIDNGQPVYQTEIGQDCAVLIRLEHQQPDGKFISLHRSPSTCRSAVADETAAIGRLLASMTGDSISIRDLKTFTLGRVTPAAWKQQVADCFLGNRGRSDRRAPPPHRAFAEMLRGCNVFTELNGVFEKFGARLVISDIEKVETVNLKNTDFLRKEGMSEEWIDARWNDHGVVPLGGFVYFRIAPFP